MNEQHIKGGRAAVFLSISLTTIIIMIIIIDVTTYMNIIPESVEIQTEWRSDGASPIMSAPSYVDANWAAMVSTHLDIRYYPEESHESSATALYLIGLRLNPH